MLAGQAWAQTTFTVNELKYTVTDETVHYVSVGKDSTTENQSKYITEAKYKLLGGAKIKINNIVYCLRGSIGNCAINKILVKGTIASSLVVIRPNKKIRTTLITIYTRN